MINALENRRLQQEKQQAEEKLRVSERLYRTLVETSPDAIAVVDLNATVVRVNRQALVLFGYESVTEVVGRNALEFIVAEDHSRALANIQETLKRGSLYNIQCRLCKKDRTRFPAELSAAVITDATGRSSALIAVVRDITARKEAEAARQQEMRLTQALARVGRELLPLLDHPHSCSGSASSSGRK